MASDLKAAVINDLQIPRHDPLAVEVATQIIADFQPDILDLNGDQTDFITLSAYPSIKTAPDETICELSEEIERTNSVLRDIVKRVKPKRVKWKNGNHEWRLLRALSQVADHRVKKILELTGVKKAWSYESLFEFSKMGCKVEFAGNTRTAHGCIRHSLQIRTCGSSTATQPPRTLDTLSSTRCESAGAL
jgi:hypothetical protein